jgi:hypothetical protein
VLQQRFFRASIEGIAKPAHQIVERSEYALAVRAPKVELLHLEALSFNEARSYTQGDEDLANGDDEASGKRVNFISR